MHESDPAFDPRHPAEFQRGWDGSAAPTAPVLTTNARPIDPSAAARGSVVPVWSDAVRQVEDLFDHPRLPAPVSPPAATPAARGAAMSGPLASSDGPDSAPIAEQKADVRDADAADAAPPDRSPLDAPAGSSSARVLTITLWVISVALVIGGGWLFLNNWATMIFGYNFDSSVYQPTSDGRAPTVSVFDNPQLLGYASSQLFVQIGPPLVVLGIATAVANIALMTWRASAHRR
ncbi:hypothetical protein [Naasia lichenicola]|uniref:Uncharacterized protein n=1 Tax=Naasia lichenicola TaxID=2565933 RepID=A0A4S4FS71_9MICO|nr:hypothetical protein [Naasia lichenicola]THG33138.1 hypothetical protein E6C64_01900 [Naasia lichenicola]